MSKKSEKTLTKDPIINRIMELLKKQNKTEKDLISNIGLGNSAFSRWKYDSPKSVMMYIDRVAEYLGVTMDYLVTGQNINNMNSPVYSKKEVEMIDCYRNMTEEHRYCIDEMINSFMISEKMKSKING